MSTSKTRVIACLVFYFILPYSSAAFGGAALEDVLSPNTSVFVSVPDFASFRSRWKRTALGGLLQDVNLKPFLDDAENRLKRDPTALPWLVGFTPGEIGDIASGRLSLALTEDVQGQPAILLALDAQGKATAVKTAMARVGKRLAALGARSSKSEFHGGLLVVHDLPASHAVGKVRRYVHWYDGKELIATTRLSLLKEIRFGGKQTSLASSKAFRATTIAACRENTEYHICWFLDPFGYWKAARDLLRIKPDTQPDLLPVLKQEGFDAIRSIGGSVVLGGSGDVVVRTFVFAPKPYARSMRMVEFSNVSDKLPPDWVPQRVSSYGMLGLRYRRAFNYYATLFDALFGDGEEGIFEDVVAAIRDDPEGPGVDLRKDLVDRLEEPLLLLSLPNKQSTVNRWLLGAPVKHDKRVAKIVDRLIAPEKRARRLRFGDFGMWQIIRQKNTADGDWGLPAAAIAVNHHYLLMAVAPETIRDVGHANASLAKSTAYQQVKQKMTDLGGDLACFRIYFKNEELYSCIWNQLRKKQAKATEDFLHGFVRFLLLNREKQRLQPVDFSLLPAFGSVRRYTISTGGAMATATRDGWRGFFFTTPIDKNAAQRSGIEGRVTR